MGRAAPCPCIRSCAQTDTCANRLAFAITRAVSNAIPQNAVEAPAITRRDGLILAGAAFGTVLSGTGLARASVRSVLVFAAASLKTALEQIAALHSARSGTPIALSFAGSSALARQIEFGAPADVFISASTDWMDALQAQDLIEPSTRTTLVSNDLVLIAHDPATEDVRIAPDLDLLALLDGGRLAMALVDAVPAGIYGKEALTSLGLWDSIAARVAQTDNVRTALALVASGEAPLGIVYATDAVAERRVRVIGQFPSGTHAPIIYPAAAVKDRAAASVADLLDFLRGTEAREVFQTHGFRVPEA